MAEQSTTEKVDVATLGNLDDVMEARVSRLPAFEDTHSAKQIAQRITQTDSMIEQAIRAKADIGYLNSLLELLERWEANQARQAFTWAVASFKKIRPRLVKDKHVSYVNRQGDVVEYDHPSLGNIVETYGPVLASVGLSHRWETAFLDGGMIRVTCIVTHEMGHEISCFLQASRDDSGSKNNIQGMGSTMTYLQRYTLLSILGEAAFDDDDGDQAGLVEARQEDNVAAGSSSTINDDQQLEIEGLLADTETEKDAFIRVFSRRFMVKNMNSIGDIPSSLFDDAKNTINQNYEKRKGKSNEG